MADLPSPLIVPAALVLLALVVFVVLLALRKPKHHRRERDALGQPEVQGTVYTEVRVWSGGA